MPDLSGDEVVEMVLLERHYGISAHEAWMVRPAWEIDVKLSAVMPPDGGGAGDDGALVPDDDADAFAEAPAWVAKRDEPEGR